MSGIDKMKDKIKKKMTLDDLPSPSPAIEREKNSEINIAVHTAAQPDHVSDPDTNRLQALLEQAAESPLPSITAQPEVQQYSYTEVQQNRTSTMPQNEVYYKKVTLYLTPELHKAFNDIYAQRMLQGRKTEKSSLICEAVELLRKKEYGLTE